MITSPTLQEIVDKKKANDSLHTEISQMMFSTYDKAFLEKIFTDPLLCNLNIEALLKSDVISNEILSKLSQSKYFPARLLPLIAQHAQCDSTILTYLCKLQFNESVNAQYQDEIDRNILQNPNANATHVELLLHREPDEYMNNGPAAVAGSRFLNDDIARQLTKKYSLFNWNFLKQYSRNERVQQKVDENEFEIRKEVILRLLANDNLPPQWHRAYAFFVCKSYQEYRRGEFAVWMSSSKSCPSDVLAKLHSLAGNAKTASGGLLSNVIEKHPNFSQLNTQK